MTPLDELFAHLAEGFSDCTFYEFEHISASVSGEPHTYTLRATQVYRRESGEWKVAHRHGSALPE